MTNYPQDDQIRAFVTAFADGLVPELVGARWIARDHGALPVYGDFAEYLAVLPDGTVFSFPDDPDAQIHRVDDPLRINLALVEAAKRYPELSGLVPERPSTAIDCPDCEGAGSLPIASGSGAEAMICRCGGIGWLP